ncbi:4-hydroxybenzoate polyprenyl transferase [Obba rivulosa]|uniref:4-hydroxybenzoate polyprenyltransferase, mitochondrial n=1 Tax=Obba rivulosa TaxID=1052685 RepID=A0A8E2ASS0_9APHY|nr:4-hydroxybenzoate polyprenyl transferase [Obba rivulosa]
MSSEVQALLEKEVPLQSAPPKATWYHYFELTRLHKFPLGNVLVFWPAAWGLTMAARSVSLPPQTFAVETMMFLLGSTLLHSAACVLNDICDRDFDAQVERTKNRPLVTGAISVFGASVLLLCLTFASMAMLLFTNRTAALIGLIGVFPLHALYPLMKRWTNWPQAWLGLAMNWGLPVAWISVTGQINWEALPIFFLGTVCWTMVYDTMYACQDRQDDIKAGVKSTAVLFGDFVKPILVVFAIVFVLCMTIAGYLNNQGPAFFAISCGGAALHFFYQFLTWNPDVSAEGGEKFLMNHNIGYIIWGGLLLDYYLKVVA